MIDCSHCGNKGYVVTMSTAEDYRPCSFCEKARELDGQIWNSSKEEWTHAIPVTCQTPST